jgi:hypothetical protein
MKRHGVQYLAAPEKIALMSLVAVRLIQWS